MANSAPSDEDPSLREIRSLLDKCTESQRRKIFDLLREEFSIHPEVEELLDVEEEILLESIYQADEMIVRMIRGVIGEAAFAIHVLSDLPEWENRTPEGNLPYDFLLEDEAGSVTVQVKLQRSTEGRPMRGTEAPNKMGYGEEMYVAETWKSRSGDRYYEYGRFDLLAVSLKPATGNWDDFLYTVADWLWPKDDDPEHIYKLQPVPPRAADGWTDDFNTAVEWLRSGEERRIARTMNNLFS